MPRNEKAALHKWADVFVLPSIVKGSATVTYGAIMAGCPVVTTPNAGSIIRDGVDGSIVPICGPEAIAQALRRFLDAPGLLECQREALQATRARAGLRRNRQDLVALVQG